MQMTYRSLLYTLMLLLTFTACTDDDSFSASPAGRLTFSVDTVKLDTVFSNVPTAAKSFWAYNRGNDGVRCTSVRLENGSKSGYRVNVDGVYLSAEADYATTDIAVRRKDSIRVFVELTGPENCVDGPQLCADNLIFTLENGTEQRVNLNAYTWDATALHNVRITRDSTFAGQGRPIIIYGGISVDSAATLTLARGTTLYFHEDAGMDVYGTLRAEGATGEEVTLRGDRIDHMFDYLPYDRTPGRWQGIRLHPSSMGNELRFTDIHSAYNGIMADSSALDREKLLLNAVTIHNCQGYGLAAHHCQLTLENTVVSNTLADCVILDDCQARLNHCTLAQFYPFDANRGASLRFTSTRGLSLNVLNSLITGYADDVVMGSRADSTATFDYLFDYCILRTPKVETADSIHFTQVTFENVKDTATMGEKHFRKLDSENLIYDFRLDSISVAIGGADPHTALPTDRLGLKRDDRPDIGAYEYTK